MAKNDPCCNINVMPLIICNYIIVAPKNLPKTLCKNSPKNPQKPHKNLVGQKLLYIFKYSNKTLCKQNFICY